MNKFLIEQLKKARQNKGMKQSDVAEILGIKGNTLSNWEHGRTEPDIDTFIKLCEIYELDYFNLLNLTYGNKYAISNSNCCNAFELSSEALEIAKAYDKLDETGRRMIKSAISGALGVDIKSDNTHDNTANFENTAM